MISKYLKIIRIITVCALCIITVLCVSACGNKEEDFSYVTIETNPSVEIICDKNNVVVAINGLNDDGKMLISDEEFTGKSIEEATELVINLTNELGFTVSSEVSVSPQTIKISVSGSASDEDINILKMKINEKVEKTIKELKLNCKTIIENSKTKDYFEKIAMAYDPTLTKEEAEAMTMRELMDIVKLSTIERAELVSIELEEYYTYLKEYEFKLAYKQEILNSLEGLDSIIRTKYQELLNSFKETINSLKATEVDYFTNPDSNYVKAKNAFYEQKNKVIGLNVKLSVTTNDKTLIEAELNIEKGILDTLEKALDISETTVRNIFKSFITNLEELYAKLEEIEKNIPTIDYNEKLTNAENYLNNHKDEIFSKFESSITKERLDNMKQAIQNRKTALKKSVNDSKNKNK